MRRSRPSLLLSTASLLLFLHERAAEAAFSPSPPIVIIQCNNNHHDHHLLKPSIILKKKNLPQTETENNKQIVNRGAGGDEFVLIGRMIVNTIILSATLLLSSSLLLNTLPAAATEVDFIVPREKQQISLNLDPAVVADLEGLLDDKVQGMITLDTKANARPQPNDTLIITAQPIDLEGRAANNDDDGIHNGGETTTGSDDDDKAILGAKIRVGSTRFPLQFELTQKNAINHNNNISTKSWLNEDLLVSARVCPTSKEDVVLTSNGRIPCQLKEAEWHGRGVAKIVTLPIQSKSSEMVHLRAGAAINMDYMIN